MDLQGKVCLVTGGTSGIGAATTLTLARRGAEVVTMSRKGAAQMPAALLSEFKTHGESIRFFLADVADPAACRKTVDEVVKDLGRLDVLVHSAGGPVPGSFDAVTEESWMNAFAVHVHPIFHLTRTAAPYMAKQGEGAIILLGSAAGMRGCLGAAAYGVVKGALPHFARVLARELAEQRIRVNCVSPGVIRTPFHDSLSPEQAANNIQNRIPLHKEGKPEDVAALIATLIENDFITGENFVIDGGMTMRIV
jgi:NAD(P)-dependent dehydrogenase (short-subunit alcohol dehydrogenase family)